MQSEVHLFEMTVKLNDSLGLILSSLDRLNPRLIWVIGDKSADTCHQALSRSFLLNKLTIDSNHLYLKRVFSSTTFSKKKKKKKIFCLQFKK